MLSGYLWAVLLGFWGFGMLLFGVSRRSFMQYITFGCRRETIPGERIRQHTLRCSATAMPPPFSGVPQTGHWAGASASAVGRGVFLLSVGFALVGLWHLHGAATSNPSNEVGDAVAVLPERRHSELRELSRKVDDEREERQKELSDHYKYSLKLWSRQNRLANTTDQRLAIAAEDTAKRINDLKEVLEQLEEKVSAVDQRLSEELEQLEEKVSAVYQRLSEVLSSRAQALQNEPIDAAEQQAKPPIDLSDPEGRPYKIHMWDDTTLESPREDILVGEGWFEYAGKRNENEGGGSPSPWFVPTDDPASADLIVWITTMGQHELEKPPLDPVDHARKVVVLDYSDGCTVHHKRDEIRGNNTELAYFKRSFVFKDDFNVFLENCTEPDSGILPYSYSGSRVMMVPNDSNIATTKHRAELFSRGIGTMYNYHPPNDWNSTRRVTTSNTTKPVDQGYFRDERYDNFLVPFAERRWTLTNVLVLNDEYHSHNIVRTKIIGWTHEFCRAKAHHPGHDPNGTDVVVDGANNANGTSDALEFLDSSSEDPTFAAYVGLVRRGCDGHCFGQNYLRHLRDAKIIVTCNPSGYEGDFRLWESFLSGAMVMVDEMLIPDWMPNPLVHGVHFVTYEANNRTDFLTKLAYYSHPDHLHEAEAIAKNGYRFVLEHHMATNRVEYILDNIHRTD